MTPWDEPLDVYYMYRSNYIQASDDPMVYIASHTWPDRFKTGPRSAIIEVYSNCDSVVLYNDMAEKCSFGFQKRGGIGTHFVWKDCPIKYNILRAIAYHKGLPAAEDVLVLDGLEKAPNYDCLYTDAKPLLQRQQGYHYLYNINCGGDTFTDSFGVEWMQDNKYYSTSWASRFPELNPYQLSQRTTSDPIHGTKDWGLFQTFRFGRHELSYNLPLPDGKYRVELYFVEPWHGTGANAGIDFSGLRIFDVAINNTVVLDDFDIWSETGHDRACKKTIDVMVKGGMLKLSFPETKVGSALICGIAVASKENIRIPKYQIDADLCWKSFDTNVTNKTPSKELPKDENQRVASVYQAKDARIEGKHEIVEKKRKDGVAFIGEDVNSIEWTFQTGIAQIYALRFNYMNTSKHPIDVRLQLIDSKDVVLKDDTLSFPPASYRWSMLSTTTGSYINAGTYRLKLMVQNKDGLVINSFEVQ